MVDGITTPVKVTQIPENLRTKLLEAMAESNAIYSGRGSHKSVAQTILSSHDRFGSSPVQINSEMVGLTFFTKPRLNLTTRSVRQHRVLSMLDTLDPMSWMFSIRANLDTVLARSTIAKNAAALSPFFNDESPFNVPLGNTLIGMSGWPDFNVEYETTESGYFSEDMTMARGSDWGRRTYNLTCTFRDIQGGYIMAYFYYWLIAMTLQMEGTIVAYPDDREANRLNYTCSIYRFVMDPSMTTIVKWAKATGCFPTNIPIGDVFNFGPGDSQVHTSSQFSIPFVANNISYMDPIHLSHFNTLVRRYAGENVEKTRTKVPISAANNFKGIPYVDLTTGNNELKFLARPAELVDTTTNNINNLISQIKSQLGTS
jgi:hypothetical protein